jgi:hypothetical protein
VEQFNSGAIPLEIEGFKLDRFQPKQARSLRAFDSKRVELAKAQPFAVEAR